MTREEAVKVIRSWDFLSGNEIEALETLVPEYRENDGKGQELNEAVLGIPKGTDPTDKKYCIHNEYLKDYANDDNSEASDANGHLTGKILVEYGAHAKVRDGKRHCEMDWKEFQRLAHYFYELGKTEQKPAEWSEEDEKMKERLITRLNWITYNTRTDGTSPNITFFDEIDWLKSLRPSWKPSEEQMICPKCGEKMILDEGKVYTSIPPKYGYKCPKCGNYEYSTKKL